MDVDDGHLRPPIEDCLNSAAARLLHYARFAPSLSDPLRPLYNLLAGNAPGLLLLRAGSLAPPSLLDCVSLPCPTPAAAANHPSCQSQTPYVHPAWTALHAHVFAHVLHIQDCQDQHQGAAGATAPARVRPPFSLRPNPRTGLNLAIFGPATVIIHPGAPRPQCKPPLPYGLPETVRAKTAIAAHPCGPFIVQKGDGRRTVVRGLGYVPCRTPFCASPCATGSSLPALLLLRALRWCRQS